MESSIKEQKILAMKKYKRAKFVYNLVLYSITSIITCFFFSYPFWFPSLNHFLSSLPSIISVSMFLNAKCFFVLGNVIVVILVGQSKLNQSSSSSSTSDIYDEYLARSRVNGAIEERKHAKEEKNIYCEEKKKEVRVCKSSIPHEEKKKGILRSSKSEVWGESGMLKKERGKGKKQEEICKSHEEKKIGMRSCKSAVWGESDQVVKKEKPNEVVKREKPNEVNVKSEKSKGKKEEEINMKSGMIHEENKKLGMRSCKSAIWSGSEIVVGEKTMGKKEEEEICKSGMNLEENKKIGMRGCKSAIWDESEIAKRDQISKGKEDYMPSEELNKRVEAFIARVNKQRLLEAN